MLRRATRHRLLGTLRRQQQRIQTLEARFQGIVAHHQDGILVVNAAGEILYANATASALFNRPLLVGGYFGVPSIASSTIIELIREDPQSTDHLLTEVEMRSHSTMWEGQQATLIILRDVTLMRIQDRDIRERESRLKAIIENSLDAILLTSPTTGQVLDANSAACDLFGCSRDLLCVKRRQDLIDMQDERWQTIFEARQRTGKARGEARFLRADGTLFEGEMTSTLLYDSEGNVRATMMIRDISERLAREQALRRREEEFRALVERNPDVVVRIDRDLRYVYANPSLERESGIALQHIVGKSRQQVTGRSDSIDQSIRDVFVDKKDRTVEFSWVGRSYQARITPEFNEMGEVETVLWIARDITDLQVAVEAQRLYKRSIEASSTGISISDMREPDHPLIYVNPAFCEITGYRYDEVVGKNCRFLQSDDRHQTAVQEMRQAIREGRETHVRLRNYRKDGTLFWNDLRLSPIRDAHGVITHYVGIQSDITLQVENEVMLESLYERLNEYANRLEMRVEQRTQELMRAKEQVETILNSTSDLLVLLTSKGNIEQVNHAFRKWFQVDSDSVFHRPLAEVMRFEHPQVIQDALMMSILANQPQRVELHGVTSSGFEYTLDGAFAVLESTQESPMVVCSLRDISLQKQLEAGLRESLAREKELGEMKTRFTSLISHEFRTPLAVIRSSAALLKDYFDRLTTEKRQSHLNKIEQQTVRLTNMMNDALLITRSDAIGFDYHPKRQNFVVFAQSVIDEVRLLHPDGSWIETDFELESELCFDDGLLRHILQNLLSNALKYSPSGVAVQLKARLNQNRLDLEVIDHGIGIPVDAQAHLFEPFYRANNVGTIGGTGLGLVIVARAVKAHQGAVSFVSSESLGTCFKVSVLVNDPNHCLPVSPSQAMPNTPNE